MTTDWDGLLRRLIDSQPQAFVSWLLEDAQFDLVTAYEFASLVFKDDASQRWLKRRIAMLDQILKNTWAYKDLMDKAKEDVIPVLKEEMRDEVKAEVKAELEAEVKAEVKREIELETAGRTFIRFVEKRFPELASVARQKIASVESKQILDSALDDLMDASGAEEARLILINIDSAVGDR